MLKEFQLYLFYSTPSSVAQSQKCWFCGERFCGLLGLSGILCGMVCNPVFLICIENITKLLKSSKKERKTKSSHLHQEKYMLHMNAKYRPSRLWILFWMESDSTISSICFYLSWTIGHYFNCLFDDDGRLIDTSYMMYSIHNKVQVWIT